MSDDAFFEAIAAAPDDPVPYTIYGDALQQRGDPRGELIVAQHGLPTVDLAAAADLRRRESELLAANIEAWLGPAIDHRNDLVVRWYCGFVHAARVIADGDERTADAVEALEALLAAPGATSTLAELRIGPTDEEIEWPDVRPVLDALCTRAPSGLRRLYLNDGDLFALHHAPAISLRGLAALPRLDTLVVTASRIALDWETVPPSLRHLELRSPGLSVSDLQDLQSPALESLVVWWPQRTEPLMKLLTKRRFPKLRSLGICGTIDTGGVAWAVEHAPILEQLENLDLSGGTAGASASAGALRLIAALAERVTLDVRYNLLPKKARDRLAQCEGTRVHPQRTGRRALSDSEEIQTLRTRLDNVAAKVRRELSESLAPVKVSGASKKPPRGAKRASQRDTHGAFKKLLRAAAVGSPRWAYHARISLAGYLDKPHQRTALCAVERERAAELMPARAIELIRIGNLCDELHEPHAAEIWLWQAVQQARWYDDADAEHRALGQLGTLRMRGGDPNVAAPILERVAEHYEDKGPLGPRAWTARQQGNAELVRSNFSAAERFYQQAIELYRRAKDPRNEAIVKSEMASVLWSRQDFAGAEKLLRESIAGRAGGELALGSTYYNLGAILNGAGKLEDARAAAEESLRIFRTCKHRRGEAQALSLLGEIEQRAHNFARAQELLEASLACTRELGAKREQGITLGNLSRVALDLGEYPRARAYCEEAIELHREVGNRFNEGMQLLGLLDCAIGERRLDDALGLVDEALVPLIAIASYPAISAVRLRRGWIDQLRGHHAAAEEHYQQSMADAVQGNYPELVGWNEIWLAVMRARDGRGDLARAYLDSSLAHLAKTEPGRAAHAMATAVVARILGEDAELPEARGFDTRLMRTMA